MFNKGRHKYTFQNVCLEDNSIILNDEAQKIILNTKGIIKDLNEELLEFLAYVEDSTDNTVKHSKGNLVKNIHKRVQEVKNDISVEVEFMTLLERDREKIEEGREEERERAEKEKIAKIEKALKKGYSLDTIAEILGVTIEEVENIRENINL